MLRVRIGGNSGEGDSTDAPADRKLSTGKKRCRGDSTDAKWDSADATRSYPEDSTDETNSKEQILFE